MPFTGPIQDRILIRELYDTFADGAYRMDRAAWLGCWTEDGHWISQYFDLQGKEAIAAMFDRIMAPISATIFFAQLGSVEVAGDTARCRALQREELLMSTGGIWYLTGRYEDELVRRDGRWLFRRRHYHVMSEQQPVADESPVTTVA